jgi:hypothetical protein
LKVLIPHFKHNNRCNGRHQTGYIEVDGEVIHPIKDLDEFFKTFGYTKEINMKGILPDEFIWDEYIKDGAKHTECLQIHLIDYLRTHSETFRQKYGAQCGKWIAALAEPIKENSELCITCKMRSFCSYKL